MKQNILKKMAAGLAAVMLTGSINVPIFAEQKNPEEARPANSVFEAVNWNQAALTAGVAANELAADFTSIGGSFAAGNHMVYQNIDFGNEAYKTMMILISALQDQAGKKMEIRMDAPDGQLLGSVTITASGEKEVFKEHYAQLAPVTGVHDVYLVFPEETDANIDWFAFSAYNGTESEAEKAERMKWWSEARFGQFIHFGAFSQLEGEYKGEPAKGLAEWIMSSAEIPKEEYKQIASEELNPTNFDAKKFVELAKAAGQKYIVFTSRHHEGLSMFDTKVRDFKDYSLFSVSNHGSYTGPDPLMELAKECKKQGIKLGTYITVMDWYDKSQENYGKIMDPTQKADFLYRLKAQIRELVDTYGIEVLWFDGAWESWMTATDARELYKYARTLKSELLVNNRLYNGQGDFGTPEQEIPETGLSGYWESCMTFNGDWGFDKNNTNWKDANDVVDMLVKCASGGGNCLLNIGPDHLGNIPEPNVEALTKTGAWMDKHSESIYGTKANVLPGLPKGVRATVKEGKLYLHLTTQLQGNIQIPNLANEILNMKVMATGQTVSYSKMNDKTLINLDEILQDDYDTVIEVSVEGMPQAQISDYTNLAADAAATGTNNYIDEVKYGPGKAIDNNLETRWATKAGTKQAYLTLTFDEPVTVDSAMLTQYTSPTNGTNAFQIEYWNGTEWAIAYTGGKFEKSVEVDFRAITSDRIRLNVTDASNPSYSEFQLYFKGKSSVAITSPAMTPASEYVDEMHSLLGKGPVVISGTAIGNGKTVEVRPFQDGIELKNYEATVQEDGSWEVTIDEEFNSNRILFTAYLKDEAGDVMAVSETVTAIYRGYQDLALNKPTTVSTAFPKFGGDQAVDGMTGSRWAPNDSEKSPWMIIDFGEMTTFNQIIIREMYDRWNTPYEYRCHKYQIESYDGSEWHVINEGTDIGENLVLSFPEEITGSKIRFTALESRMVEGKHCATSIETFEVYHIPSTPADVDKKALSTLYQAMKTKNPESYTTGSWVAFETALANAKSILEMEAPTQQEINNAQAALQAAADGLVNISTLKLVIDLAQGHKDAGDVDKLIPTAKEQFNKALDYAKSVYDNPNATQEQADKAWKTLMHVIQALSFVPGDKTELINLMAEAKAIVLSGYEDGAAKDAFVAALKEAEAMIADPDAMKADIDKAYEALDDAMKALIAKPVTGDKTELKKVIDEADIKNGQMDQYVDDAAAKKTFADALKAATDMYNKEGAKQDEIDKAKLDLLTAMGGLRLRADKSSLNDWLEELKAIDLSQYTAESADVVRAVIARAEALAAQDLGDDEQELIQAMVAEMENAKAQLEKAPVDPEEPESSSKPDDSKPEEGTSSKGNASSDGKDATDKTPTTGDALPVAALSVLAVAAAGAWLLIKRKK